MKSLKFILILFVLVFIFTCYSNDTRNGKVEIAYEKPSSDSIPDEIANKTDTCILHFMRGFRNDTIQILDDVENRVIANTDESLGYACSYSFKKSRRAYLIIKIRSITFRLPIFGKYYFIKIYRQSDDSIKIFYSKNILVLS